MKIITYITKTFKWFYCGVFKRVLSLLAIPGRNRLREKVQLRYEIFVNKGIKIPFYHYGRDNSLFIDNIIEEVNRVLCLSNDKEIDLYTKQFEEQFAEYCNCQYAVGLSSGTTALVYSLIAAGVKPGDEVILPPNTYIATAMAVQDMGARPVFVDIDPNNYNIAVERIPDVITDKTRALCARVFSDNNTLEYS